MSEVTKLTSTISEFMKNGTKQNLIVTVLHPGAVQYFADFLNSLSIQSCQKFKLFLFCDNVDDVEYVFKDELHNLDFDIVSLPGSGIAENRFFIFDFLRSLKPSNIIFGDTDDTFSRDRVECGVACLENEELVCHDLNIVNRNHDLIISDYWKSRLADNFTFGERFLVNKNILGLGNTSMCSYLLKDIDIEEHEDVAVPDWFLFYQILKKTGKKAKFTTLGKINYRQHNNLAGFTHLDFEGLRGKLHKVVNHYRCLCDVGYSEFFEIFSKLSNLSLTLTPSLFSNFLAYSSSKNYFWWEEISDLSIYYESTIK